MNSLLRILIVCAMFSGVTKVHAKDEDAHYWTVRRFQKPFDKLANAFFAAQTFPEKVKVLLDPSNRGQLFALQGLARLYEDKKGDGKTFSELREDTKKLEDALGKAGDYLEKEDFANKVGAPQSVKDFYKAKRQEEEGLVDDKGVVKEEGTIVPYANKKGWFDKSEDGMIPGWTRFLSTKVDWKKYDKDKAFVLNGLADYIKGVREDMKNKEYDLSKLEDGIHEFRRKLRWVGIMMSGLNGLVLVKSDSCPLGKKYQRGIDESGVAKGKYATLDGEEKNISPCQVSQCLFLQISKSVGELEPIKDVGQAIEGFVEAGMQHADAAQLVTTSESYKLLVSRYGKKAEKLDFQAMAQVVYDEVEASDVLKELQHEIRACVE